MPLARIAIRGKIIVLQSHVDMVHKNWMFNLIFIVVNSNVC